MVGECGPVNKDFGHWRGFRRYKAKGGWEFLRLSSPLKKSRVLRLCIDIVFPMT